jgi:hypothetical protein
MADKLSFFDWYEREECREGETPDPETKWIRGFAQQTAWRSYRRGEATHDGDCTNMPYACSLCALTDLLIEYRDYYFDKEP